MNIDSKTFDKHFSKIDNYFCEQVGGKISGEAYYALSGESEQVYDAIKPLLLNQTNCTIESQLALEGLINEINVDGKEFIQLSIEAFKSLKI